MPRRPRNKPTAHDLAAEIVRRMTAANAENGGYVVRLSRPPTLHERMQLMAAQLERRPIVILPPKCANMEEWMRRYGAIDLR